MRHQLSRGFRIATPAPALPQTCAGVVGHVCAAVQRPAPVARARAGEELLEEDMVEEEAEEDDGAGEDMQAKMLQMMKQMGLQR